MNDSDLDARLREHGTAWREANAERPGIDWDAVTAPPRSRAWIAVIGVSVAAAAIVVPLVVTADGRTSSALRPAIDPSPAPSSALVGAPAGFFALQNGFLDYVGSKGGVGGAHPNHSHGVAVGALADGSTGYGAFPLARCSTEIDRIDFVTDAQHPSGAIEQTPVTIVSGVPAATPMAVSPDGTKLAFVTSPSLNARSDAVTCAALLRRTQKLVILDLNDGTFTSFSGFAGIPHRHFSDLHWAPDGQRIAMRVSESCGPCSVGVNSSSQLGTHLFSLNLSAIRTNQILPLAASDGQSYGPVFWWHGRLVTAFEGGLRAVNGHGGIGAVLASGLPPTGEVDSVSSDASGDHLLVSSAGTTYRWDHGYLSVVPGQWTQPGW